MPLSDIEIARQAKMQPIENVAAKIGINRDQLLQYGPYKAKLSLDAVKEIGKRKPGKLILVTAITRRLLARARPRPPWAWAMASTPSARRPSSACANLRSDPASA